MFGMGNKAEMNPDKDLEKILNSAAAGDIKNDKVEVLLHAFWLLMKENGITDEKLDETIGKVLEIRSGGVPTVRGMSCPSCGKGAQMSGAFKIKCIYCGTEAILNPYEAAEIAAQVAEEEAARQAEIEQQERWNKAVENDPFKPYDVSKDLNFDEYNTFDEDPLM